MCHSCRLWKRVLWRVNRQRSDNNLRTRDSGWVTCFTGDLYTFSIVGVGVSHKLKSNKNVLCKLFILSRTLFFPILYLKLD